MIFQGDLSRYHPADALMFLANLNLNGLFSVSAADAIITLAFKDGLLIDAHSPRGDRKLIQFLRAKALLDDNQERQIVRIHSETGLSVRQILGKLNHPPLPAIKTVLMQAVMEVILELFLLENGTFNFTDTEIEEDAAGIRLETGKLSLKTMVMADEFREFVKTYALNSEMGLDEGRAEDLIQTSVDQAIARSALHKATVRNLLDDAPHPGILVLKRLQEMIEQGGIVLSEPASEQTACPAQALDPLFSAYKQALRRLIGASDAVARLSAVISFCKAFYDNMLIITARKGEVIHCKRIQKNAGGALVQKAFTSGLGGMAEEPILSAVCRSGMGFFGERFPSSLIDSLIGRSSGYCAVIPVPNQSGHTVLFFVHGTKKYTGLSAHHYLELLSWSMASPRNTPEQTIAKTGATSPDHSRKPTGVPAAGGVDNRTAELVARIDDLPPLPALAVRALNLLASPDTPLEEIEAAIGQDQALTTKLIKVANSALYSGYQKVNSLRQVLTRIGLKTTRSLILTSSTRSYFLKNRQGLNVWGRILWQHAVECGLAARRIAATVRYSDPEEAFTGGIVHDVGKLVILMLFPEKFKTIETFKKSEQISDKEAERRAVGADHEQIGRLLMDKWKMPEAIKACTEFHHRPADSGTYRLLAAITAYANYLSHLHGSGPQARMSEKENHLDEWTAWLGIDAAAQSEILTAVQADFQNTDLVF